MINQFYVQVILACILDWHTAWLDLGLTPQSADQAAACRHHHALRASHHGCSLGHPALIGAAAAYRTAANRNVRDRLPSFSGRGHSNHMGDASYLSGCQQRRG